MIFDRHIGEWLGYQAALNDHHIRLLSRHSRKCTFELVRPVDRHDGLYFCGCGACAAQSLIDHSFREDGVFCIDQYPYAMQRRQHIVEQFDVFCIRCG